MEAPPHSATHPPLSPPPPPSPIYETPHTLRALISEKNIPDQDHSEQDSSNPGMDSQKDPNFSVELHLASPSNFFRLPSFSNKRKKGKHNLKKQQALEKKFHTLLDKLRPIPFSPSKLLFFAKHEKLLVRLGLWDFVHIEFAKTVRTDFIAQLVACYDSKGRCSYVNGVKIMVNRADLGRAFKLPVKKEKVGGVGEGGEGDSDVLSEEAIGFIEDFVSNWMLLHEDMWMMPGEVLNWMKVIRDGHPEKVDWAGLLWFMVEKELTKGEQLVDCYYASHLQYLIKYKHKEVGLASEPEKVDLDGEEKEAVLAGEPKKVDLDGEEKEAVLAGEPEKLDLDGEEKEVVLAGQPDKLDSVEKYVVLAGEPDKVDFYGEEKEVVVGVTNENCLQDGRTNEVEKEDFDVGVVSERVDLNEEENGVDVADESLEVYPVSDVQKEDADMPKTLNIELTLGDDVGVEEEIVEEEEKVHHAEMMDLEEENEHAADDNPGNWQLNTENTVGGHTLQRCNMGVENELYNYEGVKEEVEDIEEEGEEEAEDTFDILENHDTLLEDGLTGNFLQAMQGNKLEFSSHEQLHSQPDIGLIASRNAMQHTNSAGPSFYGNGSKRAIEHMSENTQNCNNKRLRIDGPLNSESPNFAMCLDGVQQFITRATMLYEAKEQSLEQSNMNQQILLDELQKRDTMIEHLHKSQCEVIQKKDEEIYRLEREVYVMGNLLDGYRDSLKATQKAFAKYKQLYPQAEPEESIYKDAGPGGLMLTTDEIERRRLKQQADYRTNCLILEHNAKEAEEGYARQFTAFIEKIHELDSRLVGLENEMMKLKKLSYNHKGTETEQLISSKTSLPEDCEGIESGLPVSKETSMPRDCEGPETEQLISSKTSLPEDCEGMESGQPVSKETSMPKDCEGSEKGQPACNDIVMTDNCEDAENEVPVARDATVLEPADFSNTDIPDNGEGTENGVVSREATMLEQPDSSNINIPDNGEGTENEGAVSREISMPDNHQGTETEQN